VLNTVSDQQRQHRQYAALQSQISTTHAFTYAQEKAGVLIVW